MLRNVPIGISRLGWGTVTRPGFVGCLNCTWLPSCATSYQPSCLKRCITTRLDMIHNTHSIHTLSSLLQPPVVEVMVVAYIVVVAVAVMSVAVSVSIGRFSIRSPD
jgi:hypothetical protein